MDFSESENAGIEWMPEDAQHVLSVGISTGGVAEIRMAELNPLRRIIATTLDEKGIDFAKKQIDDLGLSHQIDVKLEDVSKPLPYVEKSFDYIYARLVLHYLSKTELDAALYGLHKVLKPTGRFFAVVRSTDCPDAQREDASYDPDTGLTRCTVDEEGRAYSYKRYFHTQATITEHIEKAGFEVVSVIQYDEQLYKDFMRQEIADTTDNVIEIRATK